MRIDIDSKSKKQAQAKQFSYLFHILLHAKISKGGIQGILVLVNVK